MILILIYVIFFTPVSLSLIPIIFQTPIFNNNKLLNIHHSVGLYKNKQGNTYKHMYVVDFSPNIPIYNIPNLCKILSGQKVPGKLRVYYFETMNQTYFLENYETFIESKKNRIEISNESKLSIKSQYLLSCYQKKIDMTSEKANDLEIIFDCFDDWSESHSDSTTKSGASFACKGLWDLDFQLYNHNCQHFGKYFVRRANNFMD